MVASRRAAQISKIMFRIAASDLDEIVRLAAPDLERLRGARLFLTGGTGFFGKWLLAALDRAERELGLGLNVTILSRDPRRFIEQWPEAENRPGWKWFEGHVAQLPVLLERFDYVLHAAADAPTQPTEAAEAERSRAIVEGTKRALALAERPGTKRLLFISSGAVYGAATGKREGASENDYHRARAAMPYGEAKRAAELACEQSEADYNIARAFAFLGPHLPLDQNFAAGNFIGDALRGGPIEVRGDGTALRSYLYPTDLVVWLLAILTRGHLDTAYNVGSDEVVSTAELARLIAGEVNPVPEVVIQACEKLQGPQNIYLPNIARAREELGLRVTVPLREAIRRTLAFHREGSRPANS
jgi:dTDP-glucose 4,6-dehydratase